MTEIPETPEKTESIPEFEDTGQDHTNEWATLLMGTEEDFPTEASVANHFFKWPHIIDGEYRDEFDCTKTNSFKLIPPDIYLEAYRKAKERGEFDI